MKITSLYQLLFWGAILSLVSCSSQGGNDSPQFPAIHPSLTLVYTDSLKGNVLLPDSTYRFALSASDNYKSVSLAFSLIRQGGTSVLVNEYFSKSCGFKYKSADINDDAWLRCGKDSAFVRVKVDANAHADGWPYLQKSINLMVPFHPQKPVISLVDTLDDSKSLRLTVHYSCLGATEYRLKYQAYSDSVGQEVDFRTTRDSNIILAGLHPAKRYTIQLIAKNASGQSESAKLQYQKLIPSGISLSITNVNRKIKFRFVSGSSELTNVEFRSVKIFDTNGQLKKVVKASVDEYFTLDDLATGTYILNVELFNYQICSRIFTLK